MEDEDKRKKGIGGANDCLREKFTCSTNQAVANTLHKKPFRLEEIDPFFFFFLSYLLAKKKTKKLTELYGNSRNVRQ